MVELDFAAEKSERKADMKKLNNAAHRASWKPYVGNAYQVCGTRHYTLTQGFSRGVNAIDVRTGGGLEYTILPDRGLDISLASFRGENLTYLTPNGEANASFYDAVGDGWFRTFFAGLLTTCGHENVGDACSDEGRSFGLHGRQNVIPAKNVCDLSTRGGDILISADIEDSVCFGAKIRAKRTISSACGENIIRVTDEFENYGIKDEPLLLLYHINFGYPLLCEDTRVFVDAMKTEPYDDYSAENASHMFAFSKPNSDARETNYIHTLTNYARYSQSEIRHPSGLGMYIRQKTDELPYLNHWKMENPVDYVLALEPSNVRCVGRRTLRETGELPILRAGEMTKIEIEFGILEP